MFPSSRTATLLCAVLAIGTSSAALAAWAPGPGSPHAVNVSPQLGTTGDFNNDGKQDVVFATSLDISVMLGNGDGTFSAAASYAAGPRPISVAAGDINGDGNIDLLVANFVSSGTVTVLPGDGSGTFPVSYAIAAGHSALGIVVEDFDRDGDLDFVVTTGGTNNLSAFLGNGAGSFVRAPGSPFTTGGEYPELLTSGDFNRDGLPDIAVTNFNSDNITVMASIGGGRFSAVGIYATGDAAAGIATGDFNGDGALDLAVTNQYAGNVSVLANNGSGSFSAAGGNLPVGVDPIGIITGDFNGDGTTDLLVANNASGSVSLLAGNGNATFQPATNTALGGRTPGLAAARFTSDSLLDVAISDSRNNRVYVLLNTSGPPQPGTLQLSAAAYSFNESSGNATVTLYRTNGSSGVVSVRVNTSNGSAVSAADYAATSATVTFFNAETTKTVSIALQNDGLYEGNENFHVALSNAAGGATLGSIDDATINIVDAQQPGKLNFSSATITGNEADTVIPVTATLSVPSAFTTTVRVATSDLSAHAESDYSATNVVLTFESGETSKTVNVPVVNDGIYEGNETLRVQLSNPTGGATLGTQAAATVALNDAQSPGILNFDAAAYDVAEANGRLNATVTLSVPHASPVTVKLATRDVIARAGTDYVPLNQMLTFNAGETSRLFELATVADTTFEGDEKLQLELSDATGEALLGPQSATPVAIIDAQQPGKFSFALPSYAATEDAGFVDVKVLLSGASEAVTEVTCATIDGEATAGSDYTAVNSRLSFAGGVTERTVRIPIARSTQPEDEETFQLTLSAPTNFAKIVGAGRCTVRITKPPLLDGSSTLLAAIGRPFQHAMQAKGTRPIAYTALSLPDGLTLVGDMISGTPTEVGTFSVLVSATNEIGSDTQSLTLIVAAMAAAGPSRTTLDSDGDGFPDEIELALGSSPWSSTSTPGGTRSPQIIPLAAPKLAIKLNFAAANADSLTLTASVSSGAPTAGRVVVDIGGVLRVFDTDARGAASAGGASIKLAAKKQKGAASTEIVVLKIAKTSVAAALADEGLIDGNYSNSAVEVPVLLVIDGVIFRADVALHYSAKAGRSGHAK